MSARRVLVAYASQTGSTAGIAELITAVLRRSGLSVDCRQASEVSDLEPYGAVVLGSGVFLARRSSDGGGFLARHAAALETRRVWLFAVGPIGRGHTGGGAGEPEGVMDVAHRIGANGAEMFGALGPDDGCAPLEHLEHIQPVDRARVRAWAGAIAAELNQAWPAPGPRSVAAVS